MQTETNFNLIKDYFENLVNQSNFLNGFTGIFAREYFEKEKSFDGLTAPVLAMFKYELGHEGNGTNTLAVRQLGFSIIFNNVLPDDIPAQYLAIGEAEILANKVLARIRFDSNDKDHAFYNSYLPNSVKILPVEMVSAAFGVDVFLNLKNPQNMKVELSDWKDITTLCP